MSKKREQRITLRCEGSPVRFDGTVIEAAPDGKHIRVRFDGPLDDLDLYAFGDRQLLSNMIGKDGNPTTDVRMAVESRLWNVL